MSLAKFVVGIDVSKDHLDCHALPEGKAWRIANTGKAIKALCADLAGTDSEVCLVFEATGGFEKPLHRIASAAGLATVKANPRHVHHFARAQGLLAKTDRIDARVLAEYARTLSPRPRPAPDATLSALRDLVARRAQLVEMRKRERQRRHQSSQAFIQHSIDDLIKVLSQQIAACERDLTKLIRQTKALREPYEILRSMPGIGPVAAATLLADLPELGSTDRRAIASLAGLAPHARDSGHRRGVRMIWGGRRKVREILYMAAVSASRCSATFRAAYQALRDRAKPAKLALIAIARKMLVSLNAMIRDRIPFKTHNA